MKTFILTTLIWGSAFLSQGTYAAEPFAYDCSPPRAVGYNAAQERLFIKPDLSVAVYEYSKPGNRPVGYRVALASELPLTEKSAMAIYVGKANATEEMQLTLSLKSFLVTLQRNLDARGSTYDCLPIARGAFKWTDAEEAIANASRNGGLTVF